MTIRKYDKNKVTWPRDTNTEETGGSLGTVMDLTDNLTSALNHRQDWMINADMRSRWSFS